MYNKIRYSILFYFHATFKYIYDINLIDLETIMSVYGHPYDFSPKNKARMVNQTLSCCKNC